MHAALRHKARTGLAVLTLGVLASCATPPSVPPSVPPSESAAETPPSAAPGRLKPMAVRPLDVKTNCRFRDEAGYAASAVLDIEHSEVKSFSATVDVPHHGHCRFDGAFTQTRRLPSVELRAQDGCTVNIWEQGTLVTVGFTNCALRCKRGSFDYVWPIIVDRTSGECH